MGINYPESYSIRLESHVPMLSKGTEMIRINYQLVGKQGHIVTPGCFKSDFQSKTTRYAYSRFRISRVWAGFSTSTVLTTPMTDSSFPPGKSISPK